MAMTMALVRAMAAAAPDRMFKDLQIAEEPDMDLEVATVPVTAVAMVLPIRIVQRTQELRRLPTRTLWLTMALGSVVAPFRPASRAATAEGPLVQAWAAFMALLMTSTLDFRMELLLLLLRLLLLTAGTTLLTLQKATALVPLVAAEVLTAATILNEPTEATGLTEQCSYSRGLLHPNSSRWFSQYNFLSRRPSRFAFSGFLSDDISSSTVLGLTA
mmetsp:Transcript_7338/g.12550  ORF Transcript_7338/g.12550 Transcript_7338/m.12550 type:complete len:216 (+) Transcript_7338:651-1298(+)